MTRGIKRKLIKEESQLEWNIRQLQSTKDDGCVPRHKAGAGLPRRTRHTYSKGLLHFVLIVQEILHYAGVVLINKK